MFTDLQYERYSRQIALAHFGTMAQEKLLGAAVLVIGAGGLGCPALLYLAGAGVGRIGIVDHDIVSLSNLHRQIIYRTGDIGLPKAACAASVIKELNPDIIINVYAEMLQTSNAWEILSDYDVIIDGTDNFSSRYLINDACVLLGKPLVYGAVSGFEGQVAVFNMKQDGEDRSIHYRDLFPRPPLADIIPNCEESGVLGVLPGIIGTMQANEAIKIITGIGAPLINRMLTYHALNNQVYEFEIPQSPDALALMPANKEEFLERDYVLECTNPNAEYFEIDASAFDELIGEENVLVIDVREEGELPLVNEFRHQNIPLSRLTKQIPSIADETIIIFCQSGTRSLLAARILADHFESSRKIYSLAEGIVQWKKIK